MEQLNAGQNNQKDDIKQEKDAMKEALNDNVKDELKDDLRDKLKEDMKEDIKENWENNIPQGNAQYNQQQVNCQNNMSRGNARYNPQSMDCQNNMSQGNAQYNPQPMDWQNNMPQGNAQYNPQPMNWQNNMPQGNTQYNPQQVNWQNNMPQGNAQYNPQQVNWQNNMPQGNAQYNPQQVNWQNNMPQGNAQYNPQSMNWQNNMPQGNAQYNPQSMNWQNNMPQGNAQYNPQPMNWQNNKPQNAYDHNWENYSYNQNNEVQEMGQSQIQYENIDTRASIKILRNSGLALFFMALAVLISGSALASVVNRFCPEVADTDWYALAHTAVCIIGVGFPVFFLVTRKIPNSPKGTTVKLGASRFIMLFFICMSAMYITNIFSVILSFFIASLKGDTELFNPVADVILNSNFLFALIYASFIAPVIEEVIFRKILLDKLRRFGDVPAILMTGLAFGLFHMNLSQFFYAAVLGFIFAYITIRTNTVKYSIILHMMVNFISTAITPIATTKNIAALLMIDGWVFGSIIVGVIFFFLQLKKIRLGKSAPQVKKSAYFLNIGTILYTIICLIMIIYATLI